MVNTWAINFNQDKLLSSEESNSLSVKPASMAKSALPAPKTGPGYTPAEMSWSMIPLPRSPSKIVKLQKIKKNPNAKSVLKKLTIPKTFFSTHASVQARVELSILNASPSGFTSRLRSKSSVVPNITTLKNSSVKFVKLNFPWSSISMVSTKNCFQLRSHKEITLSYKEPVTRKRVSLWFRTSPMKESSLAVVMNVRSESLTFLYLETMGWSRINLMDSTFTTTSQSSVLWWGTRRWKYKFQGWARESRLAALLFLSSLERTKWKSHKRFQRVQKGSLRINFSEGELDVIGFFVVTFNNFFLFT